MKKGQFVDILSRLINLCIDNIWNEFILQFYYYSFVNNLIFMEESTR